MYLGAERLQSFWRQSWDKWDHRRLPQWLLTIDESQNCIPLYHTCLYNSSKIKRFEKSSQNACKEKTVDCFTPLPSIQRFLKQFLHYFAGPHFVVSENRKNVLPGKNQRCDSKIIMKYSKNIDVERAVYA